jgi:hypothetical protein
VPSRVAVALLALSLSSAAAAQNRIGLMVSATGPTTAIGIPQQNGMDERARVLVTVRDGKFRLLAE